MLIFFKIGGPYAVFALNRARATCQCVHVTIAEKRISKQRPEQRKIGVRPE